MCEPATHVLGTPVQKNVSGCGRCAYRIKKSSRSRSELTTLSHESSHAGCELTTFRIVVAPDVDRLLFFELVRESKSSQI